MNDYEIGDLFWNRREFCVYRLDGNSKLTPYYSEAWIMTPCGYSKSFRFEKAYFEKYFTRINKYNMDLALKNNILYHMDRFKTKIKFNTYCNELAIVLDSLKMVLEHCRDKK